MLRKRSYARYPKGIRDSMHIMYNDKKALTNDLATARIKPIGPDSLPAGGWMQEPKLILPFAKKAPKMPTQGTYALGYPRGAVVHYTAGAESLSELNQAVRLGHAYLLIDIHGVVHQGFPLNAWGYHAGRSSHSKLSGRIDKQLIGIEVDCAGRLDVDSPGSFKTWFGKPVERDDVRVVGRFENRHAGAYQKFTDKQEEALIGLLMWLKWNCERAFDFDFVLGHDEISADGKTDPGGSLSMTMPALRSHLKKTYQNYYSQFIGSACPPPQPGFWRDIG